MDIGFIKGIITPILTILDENENIDEGKMRGHVNRIIDGGVHGILAFGSNGEFYMVDDDEMERGLKIIHGETSGRVPVYFGIGAIKTRKCIRLARMAQENGASGISILPPMFLKPTEEELYGYFKEIADSVPGLPVLLYNNPGRVNYSLTARLVERLACDAENIVGIKDSSGDVGLAMEFIRIKRGKNFKVFGGKDTLIYAMLAHGADGAVATTSNFLPEFVASIYNKYISGDLSGALEAQFALNPVRFCMDGASFPVAAKDMGKLLGLDVGEPYKPSLGSKGAVLELQRGRLKEAGFLK